MLGIIPDSGKNRAVAHAKGCYETIDRETGIDRAPAPAIISGQENAPSPGPGKDGTAVYCN